MHSLPIFVRLAGQPVILVGAGDAAAAKHRLLDRCGAVVVDEAAAAKLAIVAVEDPSEAAATIARLKARGILVNAVDRPDDCDFTLPAIVDRAPLLVAIGTGGASAGLAKALRQRLETLLPSGLGTLAAALHRVRPMLRNRWPDARERRDRIDAALAPGGLLDPLIDLPDNAVDLWLTERDNAYARSRSVTIALTSADPNDLTLMQARLLGAADRLYHQPAVPAAILNRGRADAVRIPADAPPAAPHTGLSLFLKMETK